MRHLFVSLCLALGSGLASASVLVTQNPAAISAFQNGLTVLDFEGQTPLGRTPQAITSYAAGVPVHPSAYLFDQAPGVQFSVGGTVGSNAPAIYELHGATAQDAASGIRVLGTVGLNFNTNFGGGTSIEIYFPEKVSRVGFWLNQQLDFVTLNALNTNFAFSGLEEFVLETAFGDAGFFVGIERPSADIGGFRILTRGSEGFTIDDFSYGVAPTVPEPGTALLALAGIVVLSLRPGSRLDKSRADSIHRSQGG